MEEQSPLQLWQSEAAWGEFPNGIIVCPIEGEGLRQYYSMPRAAEEAGVSLGSWEKQLEEARQQQRQPLATKRKRKDGTCSQKGRGLTTIMAWQKTMEQLVGFAVKWLLLDAPSLTVVLVPQVAAKFLGFLHARNSGSPHTTSRVCTHIRWTLSLITAAEWPWPVSCEPARVEQLDTWYGNIKARACLQLRARTSQPQRSHTLWQIWEASRAQLQAFKEAFKVGSQSQNQS